MFRKPIVLSILAVLLLGLIAALFSLMRPAEAAMLDSCRDRPVVFYCYPDFGCEVDPVFSKTVTEMASALGLSDENYRPCRLIIDTTKGRYEVSHPLLTLCWNYVSLCGTTARTFAQAVRGEDVIITNVHVWLERHIPNYVPIAIEDGSWTEQGRKRGNKILPVGIGYPPPGGFPEPPYP